MGRTLLDKIWDAHTVRTEDGGRSVLYIDRQYIHEVTSPVAFAGLERRGIGVARPAQITATADHNIPTVDQHLPIAETESRRQVEALEANCAKFGIEHFGVGNPRQGIVHIIGPELGFTQPDRTTFDYLRGRERAPQGAAFDQAVARWETLYSDADAVFDKEYRFDAADIAPMITYGTNPGMGMAVDAQIPAEADPKALEYMGFKAGEKLLGKPVDYVFVGSCTNGRIEDLRRFAKLVEGRRKAQGVTAWIVPGSKGVEAAARAEGLDKVLAAAGFELRQPGCSACLAMNADKIPAGKYSVSTSNRNFEGRQGPGARTMLAGIAVAAAAAVCGRIEDPRKVFEM